MIEFRILAYETGYTPPLEEVETLFCSLYFSFSGREDVVTSGNAIVAISLTCSHITPLYKVSRDSAARFNFSSFRVMPAKDSRKVKMGQILDIFAR